MALPPVSLEQLWLHLLIHPEMHDRIVTALPGRRLHMRLSTTREHALAEVWQRCPDLLLIEAAGDYEGITSLCHQFRDFFAFPIIVIEQNCTEAQRIALLDSGADDVVALKEGLGSLWVRMKAVVRRAERQRRRNPESLYLLTGLLRLDIRGRRLLIPSTAGAAPAVSVDLTLRQTMLLALLFHHQGGVVADGTLARHVFGREDNESLERVTSTFEQLRRRFADLRRPAVVERVHNRGYRLVTSA